MVFGACIYLFHAERMAHYCLDRTQPYLPYLRTCYLSPLDFHLHCHLTNHGLRYTSERFLYFLNIKQ